MPPSYRGGATERPFDKNERSFYYFIMSKGEVTRQAILDRALALAGTVGIGGITIGQLAEGLNLSKSGLFAHFKSKENLQLEVIRVARETFVAEVLVPALAAPRGLPRVRALFDRWVKWGQRPGGCIFVQLAAELDDRPGPARDAVTEAQRDWLDALAHAAKIGVSEGHFSRELDIQQFAFEMYSIMLGYHHLLRFLQDAKALARTRRAFDALIARARQE
jgi:AcrR family transcriptional regulator